MTRIRPAALLRHTLVWLAWSLLVVAGLGVLSGLLLAWRLNQGPLDITGVVTRVIVSQDLPVAVQVRRATLSWNGVREGLAAPISLTLDQFAVADPAGHTLDHVDHAAIALAPRALMAWRVAPFSVEVSGGSLRLRRRADGFVELAPGLGVKPGIKPGKPAKTGAPSFWHWIGLVRLHATDLTVDDERTRLQWAVRGADAVFTRDRDGEALAGRMQATLIMGRASTHVAIAVMPDEGTNTRLQARFSAIDPSTLPPMLLASLPALERVEAPLSGALSATVTAELAPQVIALRLAVGRGTLGGIPVGSASLAVRLHPAPGATWQKPAGLVELQQAAVTLSDGASAAVAGVLQGGAAPGAPLAGHLTITGDAIPLAGVGNVWPEGAARGARQWIIANLTAGVVHALHVEARVVSRDGLDGLDLTDLSGGFAADGLEAHWLRPVAPITDGRAILRFEGADALAIAVVAARQGRIVLDGSSMRITGLQARDQVGAIELHLAGDVGETLALLAAPRLHLLSKRPLSFTSPAGQLTAQVEVTLPLDDRVVMDQIAINVRADLAAVHLGDVALGRALDGGALHIDADTSGLRIAGTGRFAGLPVTLAASFDFDAGGPGQVTESADVSTLVAPGLLGQAGWPVTAVGPVAGQVGLQAHWRQHRDGTSTVAADADLTDASLALPVGWSKRAGQPASIHLALGLSHDRIASIAALGATGPDLDLATHGEVAQGRVRAVVVDRARIGRTRLAGRIDLPAAPGGVFRVRASGPELDLAWRFAPPPNEPKPVRAVKAAIPPRPRRPAPGPPSPGPRWEATLAAARVDLANGAVFNDVHVHFTGAGTRVAQGEARAAGVGQLEFSLSAAPGGRAMSLAANDAGRLLAAVDLSRRVHGGALTVDATIPDAATPVAGTLSVADFRIDHVPAAARFLRDLTVYGLADTAPQRGISVARLVLPFTYAPDGTITLAGARAFQSAIGVTAKGTIDTNGGGIAVDGTIVPAYAFNALPGRLPVIGQLFSPERGGGVFAATYAVRGTLDAPRVSVNPLAALVPGVLRDLLTP